MKMVLSSETLRPNRSSPLMGSHNKRRYLVRTFGTIQIVFSDFRYLPNVK